MASGHRAVVMGKYLLILVLFFAAARAQDEEEEETSVYKKPEIYSLNIYSDVKYRFATTRITSRIKNVGTEPREAIFDVTLPNEAFITNLTIEEDGQIIVGEIKKKEEARRQYVAAQQRGESAGYIGTKHRETNRFNLAVTVAAMSKISFNLTYQELLQRKNGLYEQVIYIDPGQPVPEMDVTVKILESRNITNLNVPPLRNDIDPDLIVLDSLTVIERPTPKSAFIKFFPSIEQQKAQSDSGMAGQFVVQYDVERGMDAGDIVVVNGYFVHFFAPEGLEPIPNDVLFILDNSGSMSGKKLEQLKEAMHTILKDMNEGDRINIMTFSGSTFKWQQEMMDITDEENLENAKHFVNNIRATGSTNINLALTSGIEFMSNLWERQPNIRAPVIVFLTDGQATTGVTNDDEILNNVRRANAGSEISIFSLAFGEHADYQIVKKVAVQNNGFGKRIYEASDAAMQIAGFYNEISMTLLKNLTFHYLDAPVSNLTKHHYENYFNGSEVIICGLLENYNKLDGIDMALRVDSKSINGPTVLVMSNELQPEFDDPENLTKLGDYEKITEKVWAYLTIKQLLDQELATSNQTEKLELKRRILDLSLRYAFVTPLTSMVVTNDDGDELQDPVVEEEVIDDTYNTKSRPVAGKGLMMPPPPLYSYPQSGRQYSFPASVSKDLYSYNPIPAGYVSQRTSAKMHRKKLSSSQHGGDVVQTSLSIDTSPKSRRRNKKVKKGKRKLKAYPMPLQVAVKGVPTPVCFSLYTDQLVDGTIYLLYAENGSFGDVKVLVQLETRKFGRKKTVGGIRTIHIVVGNQVDTVVSEFGDDMVINSGLKTKQTNKTLDGFVLLIDNAGDSFLNVGVQSVNYNKLSDEGILGSILSKKIKQKQRKSQNPKKKKSSLLKVNKTVVKMVLLSTVPFPDKSHQCLVSRKESVFYDLLKFKRTS